MLLATGANALLASADTGWTLEVDQAAAFGASAAIALLPMDDKRQPKGTPALFHTPQAEWMEWSGEPAKIGCQLKLGKLPAGSDRVLLVVYSFAAIGPVSELGGLRLQVDGTIEHHLDLRNNGEAAIIVGEFYLRGGQWKFRALAEGSAYGLAAMARRLGITIDDGNPERRGPGHDRARPGDGSGGATGTGFAVASGVVLTCAHVIEGMQNIHISSFNGRYPAEPVMVDSRNDMALLRVQGVNLEPVRFSEGPGCSLGDSVVAIGYPLSGLAGGGTHVTQGGVSALFGLHNDSSLLQFTAAIQPGSSGSPLFDSAGAVIGMVTSSVPDAQNMNFAVKSNLLLSFLDACHITATKDLEKPSLNAADIARRVQPSLWKVEARNH
ncbi:S1-C subfamily serine protease [Pseudomonas sp. JUb42]|uniref:trypsin-like peptidase domain-containing protein n=1 Tax=Pseudomonas sp. JUb42 TaxID=2940611 RepID=UPI00216828CA|nr:trypsin-like peptidase domain-containing protein [Pseudomonas sp. JUb42]MCS3467330.1 S1-C subfamily serine protease [Pseudomonas sp. JUb42]